MTGAAQRRYGPGARARRARQLAEAGAVEAALFELARCALSHHGVCPLLSAEQARDLLRRAVQAGAIVLNKVAVLMIERTDRDMVSARVVAAREEGRLRGHRGALALGHGGLATSVDLMDFLSAIALIPVMDVSENAASHEETEHCDD